MGGSLMVSQKTPKLNTIQQLEHSESKKSKGNNNLEIFATKLLVGLDVSEDLKKIAEEAN